MAQPPVSVGEAGSSREPPLDLRAPQPSSRPVALPRRLRIPAGKPLSSASGPSRASAAADSL